MKVSLLDFFLLISQYLVEENLSGTLLFLHFLFFKAHCFGKLRENFISRRLAAEGKRKLTSEVGWLGFFCFVLFFLCDLCCCQLKLNFSGYKC